MTVLELVIAIMNAFDRAQGDVRSFLASVDDLVRRSGLPKAEADQAKWIAQTRLFPSAGSDALDPKRFNA